MAERPRESGRFVAGNAYSPETQISKGQRLSPATEIRPGQRLSPRTEFRKGQCAHNRLPVGSVRVRTLKGVKRAWVKVADPSKWRERAKVVWEEHHGVPVPRGHVIHHKDRDPLNDSPDNLVAMTRKEHALEHLGEARAMGFGGDESRARAQRARRGGQ